MRSLDLCSETFAPNGNITAEGVFNQLGRPGLGILEVLVREAVQNSWDARIPGVPVRFGIAGWTLSVRQLRALREVVFRERAADLPLHGVLDSGTRVRAWALFDRGTTGLGGPTRADVLPAEGEADDFVNFVRNIGQPCQRALSGGTYGFGKASFYRAGETQTICVHTKCAAKQGLESRFIAAALGTPYTQAGQRFTGRHWWGRQSCDVAEPIVDREADELAARLGLPPFGEEERGTTVLVLQPNWGECEPVEAVNHMAEHLLWYCWPKMLTDESGTPPMAFEVSWEGVPVRIPHPTEFPPLEGFVRSMECLKSSRDGAPPAGVFSIDAERPARHLGLLAIKRFPVRQRIPLAADSEPVSPFKGTSHHVALMRCAELIVHYLQGPPLPTDLIEYAGVFIADEGLDAVFGDAEPPTHDRWDCEFLVDRRYRTLVRSALRRIREEMAKFAAPGPPDAGPGELTPLGAFANRLGELLPGLTGPAAVTLPLTGREVKGANAGNRGGKEAGAGNREMTGGGVGPLPVRQGARVIPVGETKLSEIGGQPAMLVEFEVEHEPGSLGTQISALPGVVLDDGKPETEPPAGTTRPKVLFWTCPDGSRSQGDQPLIAECTERGGFAVVVGIPDDVVVSVELTATARRAP